MQCVAPCSSLESWTTLSAPLWFFRALMGAFLGWIIIWKSPPREDAETSWVEACRHGGHILLRLVLGGQYIVWR